MSHNIAHLIETNIPNCLHELYFLKNPDALTKQETAKDGMAGLQSGNKI